MERERTMMTKRISRVVTIGALVALVGMAAPVSGQQEADPRLERIRTELPEAATEQIEARIAAARAAGLPVEPLLDKAVEGVAKRVPGPRIAGAVDRLAQELGRARALLGDGAPPAAGDVAAVADAMRRGVPEPAIQRMARGARPDEPLALAVHTVGDLMDRGVPVEQALTVMEAWRGRGADHERLRQLPTAVDRLIRQGVLPGQAAAALADAMHRGAFGGGRGPDGASGQGMMQGAPIPPGAGPPDDRGHGGQGRGGEGRGGGRGGGGGPPGGSGGG